MSISNKKHNIIKKIISLFFLSFFLFSFILPFATKVSAADPTVSLSIVKEVEDASTGNWHWTVEIKTTDIPDGTLAYASLYTGGEKTLVVPPGIWTIPIKNNKATDEIYSNAFNGYLKSSTLYTLGISIYGSDGKTVLVSKGIMKKTPEKGGKSTLNSTSTSNNTSSGSSQDVNYYYVYETDDAQGNFKSCTTSSAFKTETECSTDSSLIIKLASTKYVANSKIIQPCKQSTIPPYDLPQCKFNLLSKIDTNSIETNTNYQLLAPLPGLTNYESDSKINPCAFGKYMNLLIKLVIGIAAVLAMIMIIKGGFEYMASSLPSGKESGKGTIMEAILGLVIALSAYLILYTINPDLLNFCIDKSLPKVDVTIDNESETTPWDQYNPTGGNSKLCSDGFIDVAVNGATPSKINVCKSIKNDLTNLITAAKKDGYTLSGSGSRTYAQQLALRTKNGCPDVINSPSSACKTPTARPGHSKHETGQAIDFNCNGQHIGQHDNNNACYIWLKGHASTFHLKNLQGENWHWSDDGH